MSVSMGHVGSVPAALRRTCQRFPSSRSRGSVDSNMGVALLWKYLEDAEQHETLLNLNVKAFEDNASRGLRLGVDCSLWLFVSVGSARLP